MKSGNVTLGKKIGYISYDDQGSGTSDDAAERVLITTLNSTALKIHAAGNMSIDSAGFVYFGSHTKI